MREFRVWTTGALALGIVIAGLGLAACGGGQGPAEAPSASSEAPAAESAPAAPPVEPGNSVIRGSVRYNGPVPKLQPISMDADPACAAKHSGPVKPEILVLGEGNTLGNVLVWVKGGLPEGRWPAPAEPAVLDQNGCAYKPHVLAVVAGQTLRVLNSDGILHNVHSQSKVNPPFNRAMPASQKEFTVTLEKPEPPFRVKCDVHPWMGAYVAVLPHPYFFVTGPDGSFSIEGLPAGTYEVEAWHERLGTRSATITVGDDETGELEFEFTRS